MLEGMACLFRSTSHVRALPLCCLLLSHCGFQAHEVPGEIFGDDGAVDMPADAGTMSGHAALDAGHADAAVPATVTVQGRVVGPLLDPIEGWQVALGDRVATTDQNGSFTFDGVSTPYELS